MSGRTVALHVYRRIRTRPPDSPAAGRDREAISVSVRHADELELLVGSLHHALGDLTDSGRVVLVLGLGLEWTALERDQQPGEGSVGDRQAAVAPQHACLVEGLAGRVVLLPVGVARPRFCGHDDPGLSAVDARLPGVAGLHEAAVLALEGVLAHVPDVALLVLRIPVVGPLDRPSVLGDGVADDGALHAENPFGPTQDDLVVGLRSGSADALVVERGPGLVGQVAVVDRRAELRRVDLGG